MTERAPRDHYQDLLGARYSWMLGPIEERVAAELAALRRLGLPEATQGESAVDLGCGTGLHSRVLLRLGYAVRAVDNAPAVLAELEDLPLEAIEADICGFDVGEARVVLCMGDTLTHLESRQHVGAILELWRPGRILAVSFRDLRSLPAGPERFFVVRADERRIHTCFLEDAGERVRVHDLFHERADDAPDAPWTLRASAYLKLRLDPEAIVARLTAAGAEVRRESRGGLHIILAR